MLKEIVWETLTDSIFLLFLRPFCNDEKLNVPYYYSPIKKKNSRCDSARVPIIFLSCVTGYRQVKSPGSVRLGASDVFAMRNPKWLGRQQAATILVCPPLPLDT